MHTRNYRIFLIGLLLLLSAVVSPGSGSVDASVSSIMVEQGRIQIPGPGTIIGASNMPDDSAVFFGKGQTAFKIDTATDTVVATQTLVLPHPQAFILDLEVSSDGTRLFVMSWVSTPDVQIDVLSTATLAPIASFTNDVGGHRLDVPRDNSNHFVITGQYGWIQVDQNTLAITEDVVRHEQVKQGTVSHDGTRVYGQRMNTVSNDRAFGFNMDGSPLGGFTYGDGGGGMIYTEVSTNVADDRVLLFVGDSSISQNSFVLDRDGNHVQTLGIPGISYGTEGVDGETIVVTQNQGNSTSPNGGLSVIKLVKDTGTGWYQAQKLVLDDFGQRFAGDIVTTPSLNRYYVANVIGDEVIVISDGDLNEAPDCSNAEASLQTLWPANHAMHDITVIGVTDSDSDPISIAIDSIMQDEEVNAKGDGSTGPDGSGIGTSTGSVRAERSGKGDGRVYELAFTASDGNGGSCSSSVEVSAPKSREKNGTAVNSGAIYDSNSGS